MYCKWRKHGLWCESRIPCGDLLFIFLNAESWEICVPLVLSFRCRGAKFRFISPSVSSPPVMGYFLLKFSNRGIQHFFQDSNDTDAEYIYMQRVALRSPSYAYECHEPYLCYSGISLTVFSRSNTGIVGSNPNRGMDVCVRLFCVCTVLCVKVSALRRADPPSKESCLLYKRSRNWKTGQGRKGCRTTYRQIRTSFKA
jgi:hypothetical protein